MLSWGRGFGIFARGGLIGEWRAFFSGSPSDFDLNIPVLYIWPISLILNVISALEGSLKDLFITCTQVNAKTKISDVGSFVASHRLSKSISLHSS